MLKRKTARPREASRERRRCVGSMGIRVSTRPSFYTNPADIRFSHALNRAGVAAIGSSFVPESWQDHLSLRERRACNTKRGARIQLRDFFLPDLISSCRDLGSLARVPLFNEPKREIREKSPGAGSQALVREAQV